MRHVFSIGRQGNLPIDVLKEGVPQTPKARETTAILDYLEARINDARLDGHAAEEESAPR